MRKIFALTVISAAVLITVGGLFFYGNNAYSVSSRFEGKIIKRIEYVGIKKSADGKEEIVALNFIDGDGLVKKELRQRVIDSAGAKDKITPLVSEGDPLTSEAVKETIKLFFINGRVLDMRVEAQDLGDGVFLRFLCEERPNISVIEFRGLDKVMETELKDRLLIKEGEPFRKDLLEKSFPEIKKKYSETGLFNSILDYNVFPDPDKDDGSLKVVIRIDEGEDVKVAKLSILGAIKISDTELRGILETKEKSMIGDGLFKRDVFEQDKTRLITYYKQKGFLDAEIVNGENQIEYEWEDPEDSDKHVRQMYITFKVREGEQYFFDGYTFNGISGKVGSKDEDDFITLERVTKMVALSKTPPKDLSNLFRTNNDVILDYIALEKDRYDVSMLYAHFGHLNARVTPTFVDRYEDREEGGVTRRVKFRKYNLDIYEGTKSFIEKIYIRGCKKTKEKVVRREILMKEETNGVSEPFDSYKMNMTRERIFNLGLFKEVNIDIRPGSAEDKVNLVVDVQEQPTGTISVGGSWASSSGFAIFCDLGEKNLMGNAWAVNLRMVYGPTQMSTSLSFTEPWLMDMPVAWTTSVSYARVQKTDSNSIFTTGDDAEYVKQSAGYSTGLSYRFWYYFSTGLTWGHYFTKLTDVKGSCSDDVFIEQKLGMQEKRSISAHLGYDSRNSNLNPTRGLSVSLDTAMVGGYLLGGDYHYLNHTPSVELYVSPATLPFLPTYPIVFQFRGSGNFITPPFFRNKVEKMQSQATNPWVKVDDYLVLGGPGYSGSGLLRGWDIGDSDFPESWQDGLYHQLLYGAEMRVPIHPQYLWMTFFFDAGSLWTDSFWEKGMTETRRTIVNKDKANGLVYDIRDIGNVDVMSYFKYSYGFGFKIQVPMMPLRFYFGKKLLWEGKGHGYFKPISGFNFQFTIGDIIF
jgi:outer membrane protein insertion porin family